MLGELDVVEIVQKVGNSITAHECEFYLRNIYRARQSLVSNAGFFRYEPFPIWTQGIGNWRTGSHPESTTKSNKKWSKNLDTEPTTNCTGVLRCNTLTTTRSGVKNVFHHMIVSWHSIGSDIFYSSIRDFCKIDMGWSSDLWWAIHRVGWEKGGQGTRGYPT